MALGRGLCSPPQPLPAGLLSPLQVVTAETLMDLSDFSENDQAPTAGEVMRPSRYVLGSAVLQERQVTCLLFPGQGFRLEDVDWNSIAHRYPNLFTNLESSSDQK